MKHAKLSPSAASRWIRCPGSIDLSKQVIEKYGKRESSDAANWGTMVHDLTHQVWNKDISLSEIDDDEARKIVADYLECILHYQERLDIIPDLEVELRAPRWIRHIWGTVDCVLASDDTLVILDLKTGYYPVQAEENFQLLCYAALAREYYGIDPDEIIIGIYQPRARDGMPALRTWDINRQDLNLYAWEIKHAAEIALSDAGKLTFHPGAIQCQWCPAAGHCAEQARTQAILDFFNESPSVSLLSAEKIGDLLDQLPEVDTFISQLKAAALDRAMSDKKIPGYKVVASATRRKWRDEAEAEAALRKLRLPVFSFMDKKLKPFTQVAKIPKAKAIIDSLLVQPPGKPALVPESDPRANYNPADDFK